MVLMKTKKVYIGLENTGGIKLYSYQQQKYLCCPVKTEHFLVYFQHPAQWGRKRKYKRSDSPVHPEGYGFQQTDG